MILKSPTCLERNLRKNWWKYQYQAKIKINFYKLAAKKTKLLFKAKQSTFLSGLLPGNQQVQVVQGEVSCFQEQQSEVRNRTDHFPRQNREITSPEIYSNTLERNLRKNWWKYQYQAKIKINFYKFAAKKTKLLFKAKQSTFFVGPSTRQPTRKCKWYRARFLVFKSSSRRYEIVQITFLGRIWKLSVQKYTHVCIPQPKVCFLTRNSKSFPSRTTLAIIRKLEQSQESSFHFVIGERVSDFPSVRVSSGIFSFTHFNKPRQNCFNGWGDR